jgi:NADPH:quinone reductase-like Zn-dependent oxidoreductase
MQAAAIDRFGPPSELTIHTLPVPKPARGEVLIEVHAAGVGIWDAQIRAGTWATGTERFPLVLGADGAGVVVARGPGVERFHFGDDVWAYAYENPKGGFYAEYVVVNEENVGRVPEPLDLLHAGAGCVTGLTALQGIDDHLAVELGETVLIFGASGAVGTLAIQFAKRTRATVVGTGSGPAAMALVRELGADHVFDARDNDGLALLPRLAPNGFDKALVLAGGETLERCLDHVNAGGRIAYPNGVEPEPRKRPEIRVIAYDAEGGVPQFHALERAVEESRLRVPIAQTFPLAEAARAHERLEQGHVLGRIVLQIRRDA